MFPKIGVPQNGWFIMENPIKMDDFGGTICGNTHITASQTTTVAPHGPWIAKVQCWHSAARQERRRLHRLRVMWPVAKSPKHLRQNVLEDEQEAATTTTTTTTIPASAALPSPQNTQLQAKFPVCTAQTEPWKEDIWTNEIDVQQPSINTKPKKKNNNLECEN